MRGLFGKDHVFAGQEIIGRHYDEGENICLGALVDHPDYHRAWDTGVHEADSKWNITKRLTDAGIDFIEKHSAGTNPFFVTFNFQDPHPFFACPEPYASLFDPSQFSLPANYRNEPAANEIRRLTHWRVHSGEVDMPEHELRRAMATYCGQIRYVDDQIGRIISTLRNLGLLENTLVLFWSDHGEFVGDFGVTHKLPAFYECLIRVPLVLWDPTNTLPRGVNSDLVEVMDVVATMLDICDLPQPKGSRARSLISHSTARMDVFAEGGTYVQQPQKPVPNLRLKVAAPPTSSGPGVMLRTRKWKLCLYADDQGELFDIELDPHETRNLYNDNVYRDVKNELHERLTRRLMCRGQSPEELPPWNS